MQTHYFAGHGEHSALDLKILGGKYYTTTQEPIFKEFDNFKKLIDTHVLFNDTQVALVALCAHNSRTTTNPKS